MIGSPHVCFGNRRISLDSLTTRTTGKEEKYLDSFSLLIAFEAYLCGLGRFWFLVCQARFARIANVVPWKVNCAKARRLALLPLASFS